MPSLSLLALCPLFQHFADSSFTYLQRVGPTVIHKQGKDEYLKFAEGIARPFKHIQSLSSPVKFSGTADPLYDPPEAAAYLGIKENTLAVWRCLGRYDIEYVKVGRLVKYRKSALDAFLERRTRRQVVEL